MENRKKVNGLFGVGIIVLAVINIIFLIYNVNYLLNDKQTNETTTTESSSYVYDDFSIRIENIQDLLENKITGIIYIGRDTCPYCLIVNEFLKYECENNAKLEIYKFDTEEWRGNDNFDTVLEKYQINGIPEIIKIFDNGTYEKLALIDIELERDEFQQYITNFIYSN